MNRALVSISALGLGFFGMACSDGASPGGDDDSASAGSTINTTGSGTTTSTNAGPTTAGPTSGTQGATSTGASTAGAQGSVNTTTATSGSVGGTGATVTGSTGNTVGTVTGTTGVGGATSAATTETATSTTGEPPEPEPTLITSSQSEYWVVGEVTEAQGGGAATITVNEDQTFQDWLGWGGTFNEAGWDALKEVSAEDRDLAMRLLFDKNDGIGFTFGRIPVGSSDYGLD